MRARAVAAACLALRAALVGAIVVCSTSEVAAEEALREATVVPVRGRATAPVRSTPGFVDGDTNVVRHLPAGTRVLVGRSTVTPLRPGKRNPDRWLEVHQGSQRLGWMHHDVLSVSTASPPRAPPKSAPPAPPPPAPRPPSPPSRSAGSDDEAVFGTRADVREVVRIAAMAPTSSDTYKERMPQDVAGAHAGLVAVVHGPVLGPLSGRIDQSFRIVKDGRAFYAQAVTIDFSGVSGRRYSVQLLLGSFERPAETGWKLVKQVGRMATLSGEPIVVSPIVDDVPLVLTPWHKAFIPFPARGMLENVRAGTAKLARARKVE